MDISTIADVSFFLYSSNFLLSFFMHFYDKNNICKLSLLLFSKIFTKLCFIWNTCDNRSWTTFFPDSIHISSKFDFFPDIILPWQIRSESSIRSHHPLAWLVCSKLGARVSLIHKFVKNKKTLCWETFRTVFLTQILFGSDYLLKMLNLWNTKNDSNLKVQIPSLFVNCSKNGAWIFWRCVYIIGYAFQ